MAKVTRLLYLILVFVLVLSFTACGETDKGGDQTTAAAQQSTTTEAAQKKAEGSKEVNFYTNMGSDPSIKFLVDGFQEKTGTKLNVIIAPTVTDEVKAKLTTMLASSDDSFDVVWIDELMAVTFSKAGYFEPIDDIMTPDVMKDFSTDVIKGISQSGGKTYTIPMTTDGMFFWVNKKMLENAGLKSPTNMNEFLSTAKALTKDGVYGFGASWAKGGYLFNDAIRYMLEFGGDFFDWSKPGSREGLQFMYDLVYTHKVTPEAAIGETYDVMNQKFAEDKYGMMVQWTYVATGLGEKFPGTLDIAAMPEYKNNKTLTAGWHVAMNANAKNSDAAKEFMKYCASIDGQKVWTKLMVKGTASKQVLSDTTLYAELPMLKYTSQYAQADCFAPRPMNSKVNEIQDVTESIISSYLSKQISLDDCIEQGKAKLKDLVK